MPRADSEVRRGNGSEEYKQSTKNVKDPKKRSIHQLVFVKLRLVSGTLLIANKEMPEKRHKPRPTNIGLVTLISSSSVLQVKLLFFTYPIAADAEYRDLTYRRGRIFMS
jgi:hypothetical protein